MNEAIETLRATLDRWGELIEVLLNAISLLCIVAGVEKYISVSARLKLSGVTRIDSVDKLGFIVDFVGVSMFFVLCYHKFSFHYYALLICPGSI